jgi:hypothetical protein
MKNILIKSLFVSQIFFALSASALSLPEEFVPNQVSGVNLPGIYSAAAQKSQSNLGKQCKYESAAEYEESKKAISDPDLLMSDETFKTNIQQLGMGTGEASAIAYETKELCFMNFKEYTALRLYTGSLYMMLNSALRGHNKAQIQQYRIVTKFLISALNKLKNYVGYVKRGSTIPADQLAQHQVGAQIVYTGFTSTSIGSGFGGTVRYVIYSHSCKYIAPFSYFQQEEEVLCLPGIRFQIRYRNLQNGVTELLMEEVGQEFDIDQLLKAM